MSTLTQPTALQRFAAARVAVLGTTDASGAPHLVPVTFALLPGHLPRYLPGHPGNGDRGEYRASAVVFAVDHKPKTTHRLRRLDNIARHPRVSFLVDEYSDDWATLWWVRIDADAEVRLDGPQYQPALDALAVKYHQYRAVRPHGPVVIAAIRNVTGWSLAPAP